MASSGKRTDPVRIPLELAPGTRLVLPSGAAPDPAAHEMSPPCNVTRPDGTVIARVVRDAMAAGPTEPLADYWGSSDTDSAP